MQASGRSDAYKHRKRTRVTEVSPELEAPISFLSLLIFMKNISNAHPPPKGRKILAVGDIHPF